MAAPVPAAVLAGALVMAALLSACLDFTAPDPQAARVSSLNLLIVSGDDSPAALSLLGSFLPGIDRDGARPAILREEIRVGSELVPPIERGPNEYRYVAEWDVWPGGVDGSEVPVEGVILTGSPSGHELRLPLLLRDGPDTLALAPGEDLVLPLRAPSQASVEEAQFLRWRLQVEEQREEGVVRSLLVLDREGSPGEAISVPSEWLGTGDRPLRVRLFFDAGVAREAEDVPYRMNASLRVDLRWEVLRSRDPAS